MAFRKPDTLFITYTHPDDQKQHGNRRAVSSFVSKSYRPTSKKIVFEKSQYRPFARKPLQPSKSGAVPTVGSSLLEPVPLRSHSESPQLTPLHSTDDGSVSNAARRSKSSSDFPVDPLISSFDGKSLVDILVERYGRALNMDRARYESLLNEVTVHAEGFHALMAQTQSSANINGSEQPDWKTLYHRGEVMKLLRQQMQSGPKKYMDCAIFTTSTLLTVEYAHTDHSAWLLHKRALRQLIVSRGTLQDFRFDLKDNLLRNEWFIQVLVKSRVVVDDCCSKKALRFKDRDVATNDLAEGMPPLFAALYERQIMTTTTCLLIKQLLVFLGHGSLYVTVDLHKYDCQLSSHRLDGENIQPILSMIAECKSGFIEHQVVYGLLLLMFGGQRAALSPTHLQTLDQAATDMITVKSRGCLTLRKSLLWSVMNIGCASITSPMHDWIPSMQHMIPLLNNSEKSTMELRSVLHAYYLYDTSDSPE
jgi:hypothetical protein